MDSLELNKSILNRVYDYMNNDDGYHEVITGSKLTKQKR